MQIAKAGPRDLLSSFIGTMVCVEGIVTKCFLARSKVVKSVHYCPVTGIFLSHEYRDITSFVGLPTCSVYPSRDENGNLLVDKYWMCGYKDHQTLSMQEVPENVGPGQLPRTVDVIVENDLVDCCKPGDRVSIVGLYKGSSGEKQRQCQRCLQVTPSASGDSDDLLNPQKSKGSSKETSPVVPPGEKTASTKKNK